MLRRAMEGDLSLPMTGLLQSECAAGASIQPRLVKPQRQGASRSTLPGTVRGEFQRAVRMSLLEAVWPEASSVAIWMPGARSRRLRTTGSHLDTISIRMSGVSLELRRRRRCLGALGSGLRWTFGRSARASPAGAHYQCP